MQFSRDVCVDLDRSLRRLFLVADGVGGYASLTLVGAATSRFHGLVVTPLAPAGRRHVLLGRLEESLTRGAQTVELGVGLWRGAVSPHGHQYLESFRPDPWPCARYRIGDVVVTRETRPAPDGAGVLVRWSLVEGRGPVTLRVRPFLPYREAEKLTVENGTLDGSVAGLANGIRVQPYAGLPPLALTLDAEGGGFEAAPGWYRGVEFRADLALGHDGHEDEFSPGFLHAQLTPGRDVVLAAAPGDGVAEPAAAWRTRDGVLPELADDDVRGWLARAADAFLYRAPDGRRGVIAGYPWFGEWGRDAFVALPGLTLARGLTETCGEVLSGAVPWLRAGRLPNVWRESPSASCYRAIDPALWFAWAAGLYIDAGGDRARVADELLPALRTIADAYAASRDEVVRVDDDLLLATGGPDFAFTWMDCVPVRGAARHGAPVEVNALWYALLDLLARLERRHGTRAESARRAVQRERVGAAFVRRYWRPADGCLADTLGGGAGDALVRPNMVIAAALAASPLDAAQRLAIVDLARAELLTPRGLRTLSPRHIGYRGRYAGNRAARDAAYHQGTAWPWLLGSYVEARLRAVGRGARVKRDLRALLDAFAPHLAEGCLGQVAEVFDGDPPHAPGGAFAQAWSVGELLRAYALLDGAAR